MNFHYTRQRNEKKNRPILFRTANSKFYWSRFFAYDQLNDKQLLNAICNMMSFFSLTLSLSSLFTYSHSVTVQLSRSITCDFAFMIQCSLFDILGLLCCRFRYFLARFYVRLLLAKLFDMIKYESKIPSIEC